MDADTDHNRKKLQFVILLTATVHRKAKNDKGYNIT